MASDLSLLFLLRAKNEASPVVKQAQGDVQQLRKSVATDFTQMQQVATTALGKITQSITGVASNAPVLGKALGGLTSEMTSLAEGAETAGSGMAAFAGPAGLAAAAAVACGVALVSMVTAVIDLDKSIFSLTTRVADFQGKLLDFSQQTGVSVETLSALEIAATQVGGSLESVVQPLNAFQRKMEEAKDSTSKAAATFKSLDVEVTDTEDTLRSTLKALSEMPEGFEQTARAQELFGKGGKIFLAILKETNGDLDKLIENLRDSGLVTTEQAQAADELNDQLARLQFQFRGLGSTAVPLVSDAIKDLSQFVKENQLAFKALEVAIAGAAQGLLVGPLKAGILLIQSLLQPFVDAVNLASAAVERFKAALRGPELGAAGSASLGGKKSGLALLAEVVAAGAPLGPTKGELGQIAESAGLFKSSGGAKGRAAKADPGIELLNRLKEELANVTPRTRAQEVAQDLLNKKYKDLNPILKETILTIAKTIDVEKELKEEREKSAKSLHDQGEALTRFLQKQHEDLRQITEGNRTALGEVEDFVASFKLQFGNDALTQSEEFWLRFNAMLIRVADTAKDLTKTLANLAAVPLPPGLQDFVKANEEKLDSGKILSDEQIDQLGKLPEAMEAWKVALRGVREEMESFSNFTTSTLNNTLVGLADALAQGITAWALYGQSFGKAMRQALAALAAKIAAEALFQAALHAAYAIASLAFGDFASAGQHAIAAAKFAGVAALAGFSAKAIAGSSFSGGGGASAGGSLSGGAGTRTTATSPTGPRPVDLDRNRFDIHFHVTRDEGSTVRAWVENYRKNGEVRSTIQEDR